MTKTLEFKVIVKCWGKIKNHNIRGAMLLAEYDRLKFPDEHKKSEFGCFTLTIPITYEQARKNSKYFNNSEVFEISIESKMTTPENWEDHGSAGMQLTSLNLFRINSTEFKEELLSNNEGFLKIENKNPSS